MTPFDTLRASLESPLAGVNFMSEWDIIYQTRIGSLCGTAEPSATEKRLAREEADAAIRGFRDRMKLMETFNAGED